MLTLSSRWAGDLSSWRAISMVEKCFKFRFRQRNYVGIVSAFILKFRNWQQSQICAVTGQVCMWSLKLKMLSTTLNIFRDCLKVCAAFPVCRVEGNKYAVILLRWWYITKWRLTFHPTIECGRSEQLQTLLSVTTVVQTLSSEAYLYCCTLRNTSP